MLTPDQMRSVAVSVMLSSAFIAPINPGPMLANAGQAGVALQRAAESFGAAVVPASSRQAPSRVVGPSANSISERQLARLREISRDPSRAGDISLNKGVTDALGITSAQEPAITVRQMPHPDNNAQVRRTINFLPAGRGYMISAINGGAVTFYYANNALKLESALGRAHAGLPIELLPTQTLESAFKAELSVWASFSDAIGVAAR